MSGRVEGKVAIVTGAGSGIGRGIACLLAQEGASVVVANRNEENGHETDSQIRDAGGTAVFSRTDVIEEASCAATVALAVSEFGGLDALVNCAGIFPRATLVDTTRELWDRVLGTNVRGPFFMCKHAAPHLLARGGGSIVNIGSGHSYQGFPNLVAYAASKGALLNLTKTLANAYTRDHIRVNMVLPGWVMSDNELSVLAEEGLVGEALQEAIQRTPMARCQTPNDAGWAVVYLASDESINVTGTVINANGGWMIVG